MLVMYTKSEKSNVQKRTELEKKYMNVRVSIVTEAPLSTKVVAIPMVDICPVIDGVAERVLSTFIWYICF